MDLTGASKYLFQGIDYSDGNAVLQPNLVFSYREFSAVCWSNYQGDTGEFNEIDLSLKYGHTFDKLTVSPGYTYLRYPNRLGWTPSQELFVDMALSVPLSPTLSVHYDFDSGRGAYATAGVSQSVGKSPVSVGMNLFQQIHYYDMSGQPAMELKASAVFPLGTASITPSISRFVTWENGDFRGPLGIPATWLFALNVGHPLM